MARPTTALSPHTTRNRKRWRERLVWLKAHRATHGRDWEREYRTRNHAKYNARFKAWLMELRHKAFAALGGAVCKQCGFSDVRALQIDHIVGGQGRKDRAQYSTPIFYRHVIEEGSNKFQVLCANCNTIKKIANREFGKEIL